MKKKNLNKEGFWFPMMEKYPKAVELFYGWIESYERENRMDKWSSEDEVNVARRAPYEVSSSSITFYTLPVEMQVGITARFFMEYDFSGIVNVEDYIQNVEFLLSLLDSELNAPVEE